MEPEQYTLGELGSKSLVGKPGQYTPVESQCAQRPKPRINIPKYVSDLSPQQKVNQL